MFSRCNTEKLSDKKEHWVITSVLLWSAFVCISSVWYVIFGINKIFSIFIILAAIGIFLKFILPKKSAFRTFPSDKSATICYILSIITCLILVLTIWNGRADAALRSPWEITPIWFFFVFGISLSLSIVGFFRDKTNNVLSLFALTAQIGLFYGIAVIAFRFGYGYDPIIHQAAENYIAAHGKITPLKPFYIGQYSIVTIFHFVTPAPIWLVDRLLLPTLTTLSIPIVGYIGLQKGWGLTNHAARIGVLSLASIPFAEFTFTVPHNLTVLYALWWILLLPIALKTNLGKITLFGVASAACITHPLVGISLLLGTLLALIAARYKKPIIIFAGGISIGISSVLMMGFYRIQQSLTLFTTTNPLDNFSNFISIFKFTPALQNLSVFLQVIYRISYFLPFVIILLGFYFAFKNKKIDSATRWTALSLIIGIFLSIFLISTLIHIPGIAEYEQNEFVLRLRSIIPIFILPIVISGISDFIQKQQFWKKTIACTSLIFILLMSLYFSYPRTDGATRPGWNISRSDIDATRNIAALTKGKPYVVLSNQIMAVAGLRELGFEKRLIDEGYDMYPYPISIQEPLHPFAQQILYSNLDGAHIRALAELIGGSVFVAVHDYWYRTPDVFREALDSNPDAVYTFGQITIFEFR